MRQLAGIKPGSGKPEVRFCLFHADQEEYFAASTARVSSPVRRNEEPESEEAEASVKSTRLQLGSGNEAVSLSVKVEAKSCVDDDHNAATDSLFYIRFEIFGIEVGSEEYVGADVMKLGELFELDLSTSANDLEEYAHEHGIISFFLYRDSVAIGHAILDISKLSLPCTVQESLSFVPLNDEQPVIESLDITVSTHVSILGFQTPPMTRTSDSNQFRISIDTHSIQMLSPQNLTQVYTGYKYPALGSSSPIYSLPPVEATAAPILEKDTHLTGPVAFFRLKNSFNAYEIVFTQNRLQQTLKEYPLEIELWNRTAFQSDELIGKTIVDMGDVQEKGKRITRDDGTVIWALDKIYPVFGPNGQAELNMAEWSRLVAHIRLVFSVEDFGPLEDGEAVLFDEQQTMQSKKKIIGDDVIFSETTEPLEKSENVEIDAELKNFAIDEDVAEWIYSEQQKFKQFLEDKENGRLNVISKILDEEERLIAEEHDGDKREIDELIVRLRTFMVGLLKREKSLQEADVLIANKRQQLKKTLKWKKMENERELHRLKQQYYNELSIRGNENERMRSVLEDQLSAKKELQTNVDNLKRKITEVSDKRTNNFVPIRQLRTELDELKDEIVILQKQTEQAEFKTSVMKRRYADILSEADEKEQLLREEQENTLKQERSETERHRFQEWLTKSRSNLHKDLEDMRMLKQTAMEALNRCTLREIQQEKNKLVATISAKDRQLVDGSNDRSIKTSSWTLEDDDDDDGIIDESLDKSLESLRVYTAKKPPMFPEKTTKRLALHDDACSESDADTEYDEVLTKTDAIGEDERALIEELNAKYSDIH